MHSKWASKMKGVVDGHVHMGGIAGEADMLAIRETAGISKMNLVAIQNPQTGDGLPEPLYMKARHPGTFYVFAGLNHAERISGGRVKTASLAAQVESFVRMGCDGIKMIEGKPTARQIMNVPVTDAYFADYWARVEELGIPIVWHVNDPEEFWDPAKIPGWAKERDWGYGPQDAQKEQLYAEVDAVLRRHPGLKTIFAHFYFLSADLPRATRFLEEHPNVGLDLAPGVEMLYNISRNPEAGREFFIKYADRIVFGTDLFSTLKLGEARFRAGIIFRWLESGDTFRVPDGADFLLGPPEDGIIRGMSLPDDVLSRIYRENFTRIAGSAPKPLNFGAVIEECGKLAAVANAFSGKPAGETEAGRVAKALAGE
ncbi:MAG TPA: amidohydrolase family protein [Candidatus Brocadiia bacterium]|nr:amidohydrolase family protein [Candidatus Brocadiia bacterium]